MNLPRRIFTLSGVGITLLLIIPIAVFIADAFRNQNFLSYNFEYMEDPPKIIITINYNGGVALTNFNIKIMLSNNYIIEKYIDKLERGSSFSIEVPLTMNINDKIVPIEIKLSFKVIGIYLVEVDINEQIEH